MYTAYFINVLYVQILEVKKDPVGKKKQKSKNTFKKVQNAKQKDVSKYHDAEDMDRKIVRLSEENKVKANIVEQVMTRIELNFDDF